MLAGGVAWPVCASRLAQDLRTRVVPAAGTKSMKIAADMCIYTNDNFTIESINLSLPGAAGGSGAAGAAGGITHYP